MNNFFVSFYLKQTYREIALFYILAFLNSSRLINGRVDKKS